MQNPSGGEWKAECVYVYMAVTYCEVFDVQLQLLLQLGEQLRMKQFQLLMMQDPYAALKKCKCTSDHLFPP